MAPGSQGRHSRGRPGDPSSDARPRSPRTRPDAGVDAGTRTAGSVRRAGSGARRRGGRPRAGLTRPRNRHRSAYGHASSLAMCPLTAAGCEDAHTGWLRPDFQTLAPRPSPPAPRRLRGARGHAPRPAPRWRTGGRHGQPSTASPARRRRRRETFAESTRSPRRAGGEFVVAQVWKELGGHILFRSLGGIGPIPETVT